MIPTFTKEELKQTIFKVIQNTVSTVNKAFSNINHTITYETFCDTVSFDAFCRAYASDPDSFSLFKAKLLGNESKESFEKAIVLMVYVATPANISRDENRDLLLSMTRALNESDFYSNKLGIYSYHKVISASVNGKKVWCLSQLLYLTTNQIERPGKYGTTTKR